MLKRYWRKEMSTKRHNVCLLSISIFCQIAMAIWSPRAEAIYIRADLGVSRYLDLANAPAYQSAGWFAAQKPDGSYIGCTGALIATNKALTAAHCLDANRDGTPDFATNKLEFGFGNNLFSPANIFAANVKSVALDPLWSSVSSIYSNTYDMAILTLSGAILNKTPAVLLGNGVSPYQSGNDLLRYTGVMVGYGQQGDGNGDPINWGSITPQSRLAATNYIDSGGADQIVVDFDNINGTTNSTGDSTYPRGMLEGSPCSGDSGGPLFVNGYIVGVLSGGINSFGVPCQYGTVSAWAPVGNSNNINFLRSQGGVVVVPEPPVLLLLLTGLAGIGIAKRRSRV
jgi:hypothetical protein